MSDFKLVEANRSRVCLCGSQVGPLVDTARLVPVPLLDSRERHWVLCEMCTRQVAYAAGYVPGDVAEGLAEDLHRAREYSKELEGRVAELEAGQPKVVSLDDARQLVEGFIFDPQAA